MKTLGKGNDYTTGFLFDYPYFKENYQLIAIDLSKQQGPVMILEQLNRLILLQI